MFVKTTESADKEFDRSTGIPISIILFCKNGRQLSGQHHLFLKLFLWSPFQTRYVLFRTRDISPDYRAQFCPKSWTPERRIPQMVFSPHWYDLDALFRKEFGRFTANVQALSRVSKKQMCSFIVTYQNAGHIRSQGILLGSPVGSQKLRTSDTKSSASVIQISRGVPCDHRRNRCSNGHEVRT